MFWLQVCPELDVDETSFEATCCDFGDGSEERPTGNPLSTLPRPFPSWPRAGAVKPRPGPTFPRGLVRERGWWAALCEWPLQSDTVVLVWHRGQIKQTCSCTSATVVSAPVGRSKADSCLGRQVMGLRFRLPSGLGEAVPTSDPEAVEVGVSEHLGPPSQSGFCWFILQETPRWTSDPSFCANRAVRWHCFQVEVPPSEVFEMCPQRVWVEATR